MAEFLKQHVVGATVTAAGASAHTPLNLPLDAGAVEALGAVYAEPAWMREARRAAWQQYEALPLPDPKAEAWRRVPVKQFPLDNQRVVVAPRPVGDLEGLPPCWLAPLAPEEQVAGLLVHYNSAPSYFAFNEEVRAQGVVLSDLHEALHTHGDLIRRHWMQGTTTRPDFNKFTALNAALWSGGTFIYVPAGVRVLRPLQVLVGYNVDGGAGLHHTLIVVEKGARVTVLQDRISQERHPALNTEVVEIIAEEGAWVRYASLQHWGDQSYTVGVQEARLARNANLWWLSAALGGRVTKEFLRSELTAPGARAIMQGYGFATGTQILDQSTYQHHQAPDTYSDLLFRNVLRDQAKTVFYGMIRVEPEAQGTQGYQANNNLLLGDARAHSIPGLEIIANDVSCSHGSTLSRIDDEQLFYLQARGVPRLEAEQLIVQGFVRPVIEQVPLACMRDRLDEEIAERFWLT